MRIKNITLLNRFWVFNRIRTNLFFHYLPLLFKKDLSFKRYILLQKRISTFLKITKINKFYKIGKLIKIDQSIPFFGTHSFYKFWDKFKVFDGKIPGTSVLISVTKECSFKCKHCYQREDQGTDVDINSLMSVTRELVNQGITLFNIEGGDPFLEFSRLESICETIGYDGEIWINSTGNGITLEKLKKLKSISNFKSVVFPLNSPNKDDVNFFMGQDYAWNTLVHGLKLCRISNIPASLSCCLHNDDFHNGNFEYLMEIAKEFKVAHVTLIPPKAAGAWLKGEFLHSSESDIEHIKTLVKHFNKQHKYRKYPSLSAQLIDEDSEHQGCTAGGTDRFYINAKGDIQPCEFLNISFGNINKEDFIVIYNRMRKEFNTPGVNWLCDQCSKDINSLHIMGESLPLTVEKSKIIIDTWQRGDATPVYSKIEDELI
ncbi:MAG: hypothetical protein B6229_04920 [Spirochaetaceae bacterium 4572_7]|nr:MAG: hypothetical protein B6229_04920 [Spirochaetaceae bacterium 4572_7]